MYINEDPKIYFATDEEAEKINRIGNKVTTGEIPYLEKADKAWEEKNYKSVHDNLGKVKKKNLSETYLNMFNKAKKTSQKNKGLSM